MAEPVRRRLLQLVDQLLSRRCPRELADQRSREVLLTPQDVAGILKVKPARVYEAVRDGRLPAIRITGKPIRFRPQDVERFIRQCWSPET